MKLFNAKTQRRKEALPFVAHVVGLRLRQQLFGSYSLCLCVFALNNFVCITCITLFLFILPSSLLCGSPDIAKRVQAHLTIGDPGSAKAEIESLLRNDPNNLELLRLQIRCLAASNDTAALLRAWRHFNSIKNGGLDRDLIEEVSWAIIRKSSVSSSPIIRFEGMLSAFFSNDAKGIPLCLNAFRDPSVVIRSVAVSCAAQMRDEELQNAVLSLFLSDTSSQVREASIVTLGHMRNKNALELLQKTLISDASSSDEKNAAIEAISGIVDNVDASIIERLVKSNRSHLRALACQLVCNQLDESLLSHILPCMHDASPDVRLLAMQAYGIVANQIDCTAIRPLATHPHLETAITANWLLFLAGSDSDRSFAKERVKKWLLSNNQRAALLTASALRLTGSRGVSLAKEVIKESNDSLLRINLAVYLIWQREKESAQVIADELDEIADRLSWESFGFFDYVAANSVPHVEGNERLPEATDMLTRLDLYSMLATCDSQALPAILKSYLKDHTWGVSGKAASLMIQEGCETLEALRDLLSDPSETISLQAAFILAFYSQDQEALAVLLKHYPKASRAIKERILYGIGSIGSSEALPFLVQVLDEPFEGLRIAAARAILGLKN